GRGGARRWPPSRDRKASTGCSGFSTRCAPFRASGGCRGLRIWRTNLRKRRSAAMTRRVSTTILIGGVALLVVTVTSVTIAWRASNATIAAGFWWADTPFVLSADDAGKIGGPLTPAELESIEATSRDEVRRAYADLRIDITDRQGSFWRVAVVGAPLTTTRNRTTYPFSFAGESRVFGPLGGSGSVAFAILAHNAIEYAPAGASRRQVV